MFTQAIIPAIILMSNAGLQEPRTIPDTPSCPNCRIVIGPTQLTLADPLSVAAPLSGFLAEIGGHRYLAGAQNGAPRAFDSAGRFLQSLGRTGPGPGEFRTSGAFAVGPGDSVAVFDPGNGRIQIFDGRLKYVRAFTTEQMVTHGGLVWLPRGEGFAMSGVRSSPSQIGYTIHYYTADGTYRRSIAESSVPILPSRSSPLRAVRLLQLLPTNELLAVTVDGTYQIEIWNPASGTL